MVVLPSSGPRFATSTTCCACSHAPKVRRRPSAPPRRAQAVAGAQCVRCPGFFAKLRGGGDWEALPPPPSVGALPSCLSKTVRSFSYALDGEP